MITKNHLDTLNNDELAYLYYCCDKEFDKNGYVYFDFDAIRHFKKQCIIDIVYKYIDSLSAEKKEIPSKIIAKLENIY